MRFIGSDLPPSVRSIAAAVETRKNIPQIFSHLDDMVRVLLASKGADVFADEDGIAEKEKEPWFNVFTLLGGYYVSLRLLTDGHVENIDCAYRWIRTSLLNLFRTDFYKSSLKQAEEYAKRLSNDLWRSSLVDRILDSIHRTTGDDVRRFDRLALMHHDLFVLAVFDLFPVREAIEGEPKLKALIRRCLVEDPYGLGDFTAELARNPENLPKPLSFAAFIGLLTAYVQGRVGSDVLIDAFKRAFRQEDRFIPFLVGVLVDNPDRLPKDWDALLRRLPPLSDFVKLWRQNRYREIGLVEEFYKRIHPAKKPQRSFPESSSKPFDYEAVEKMKKRLLDFALALTENASNLGAEIESLIAYAKDRSRIDLAAAVLSNLEMFAVEALSANTSKPELWTLISMLNEQEIYLRRDAKTTAGKDYYVPILFSSRIGYMLVRKHGQGYYLSPCVPRFIIPGPSERLNPEVLLDWKGYDSKDFEEDPETAVLAGKYALKACEEPCRLLLARYRQISQVHPFYRLMEFRKIDFPYRYVYEHCAVSI